MRGERGVKKEREVPWTKTFSTSSDQTSPWPDFKSFLCLRWGVRLSEDTFMMTLVGRGNWGRKIMT